MDEKRNAQEKLQDWLDGKYVDPKEFKESLKETLETMKTMAKEFDDRFANHKLVRVDLQDKLKKCYDDRQQLVIEKRGLQENLIKQQDLLEWYSSQQPLKEYKEKAQIYEACLKRVASRSDWVGDDLRDNMIQNMAKDALLTLKG